MAHIFWHFMEEKGQREAFKVKAFLASFKVAKCTTTFPSSYIRPFPRWQTSSQAPVKSVATVTKAATREPSPSPSAVSEYVFNATFQVCFYLFHYHFKATVQPVYRYQKSKEREERILPGTVALAFGTLNVLHSLGLLGNKTTFFFFSGSKKNKAAMVAEETAITIAQTAGQLLQERHLDTFYQTNIKIQIFNIFLKIFLR